MYRMKIFAQFAFVTIAFFIFSNIMINIAIKTTYDPIDSYIQVSKEQNGVEIDVNEAKATFVNGYVGGKIVNSSDSNMFNKYLKIDMFSKRDVLLGTKYINIGYLKPNNEQDFRIGFKYTNVDYCRLDVVDEIPETVNDYQFMSDELRGAKLMATVIMLCYM